jgi:hypothetical protein
LYPNPGKSAPFHLPDIGEKSHVRPALAFHNAQLEASAFGKEFDPEI